MAATSILPFVLAAHVIAAATVSPAQAQVRCSAQVSKLMSRDTEKLSTRYQRVRQTIEKRGGNPKLYAEGCRIARALEPMLSEQIAALKQSGCSKDPEVGSMVTDIVRGHEDDLISLRRATQTSCR